MIRAWLLLGCLMSGLAACEVDSVEPVSPPTHRQPIVGGDPTLGQIWTGVVALVMKDQNGGLLTTCTGTLIAPRVVLSAGHCAKMNASTFFNGYDMTANPERVQIKTGAEVGAQGAKGELLTVAEAAVYHETWTGDIAQTVESDGYDFSMFLLKDAIDTLPHYCVRQDTNLEIGLKGVIVGYGVTGSGPTGPASNGVARYGETTLLKVWPHKVEIGDPSATCNGDSGGPLFTEIGGRFELTGVTSYGGTICYPKKGGAFSTNVTTVWQWISDQVEEWTGAPLGACTGDGPGGTIDTGSDEPQETQDEPPTGDTTQSGTEEEPTGSDSEPLPTQLEDTDAAGTDEDEETSGDSGSCSTTSLGANAPALLAWLIPIL